MAVARIRLITARSIQHVVLYVLLVITIVNVYLSSLLNQHLEKDRSLNDRHSLIRAVKQEFQSNNQKEAENSQQTVMFSHARQDRSGAFLQDMLMAHAYAFANHWTYGGACEPTNEPAQYRPNVEQLVASIGLSDILRFDCPKNDIHSKMVNMSDYFAHDTDIWTEPWLQYMHSHVHYDDKPKPMAVHIRRGDVGPCPDFESTPRYLPNQHYLKLIETYRPSPDTPVYVYSESESAEPWDDFRADPNIHLELDTPIEQVYQALISADILIMSKSSFTLVAAMLNARGKIIYTPFWHRPLPHWTVIDPVLVAETNHEVDRLRLLHKCPRGGMHKNISKPQMEAILAGMKAGAHHKRNGQLIMKQSSGTTKKALPREKNGPRPTIVKDIPQREVTLSCDAYGGPLPEHVAEMVYWRDIPSDNEYKSPFATPETKYLTFEPDEAGFNNVRMAMETAVVLAQAMGRTLVLPPKGRYWGLDKKLPQSWMRQLLDPGHTPPEPIPSFDLSDLFHFGPLEQFPMISFDEFLKREGVTGHLRETHTGRVTFPPDNRTNFDGRIGNHGAVNPGDGPRLWRWMRNSTTLLGWSPDCIAAFPADKGGSEALQSMLEGLLQEEKTLGLTSGERVALYDGHPTPVDASAKKRLEEMLVERNRLCLYNETLQEARVIHLPGQQASGYRLLVHFYAFVFFERWQDDLRTKRFIRDHVRYTDEIQCAAARIVHALRETERSKGRNGSFDTMHLRRNDFTNFYKGVNTSTSTILSEKYFKENRTIYVATDEHGMSWFDSLREHYTLYFLDDFKHLLDGVNPNYFGMIEQLVAARGDTFVGTYYSTFSGYINRIRGYHSQKSKPLGHQLGILNSQYIGPNPAYRSVLKKYRGIHEGYWYQEWSVAWRNIDANVQ